MKRIFLLLLIINYQLSIINSSAQPVIQWQKCLGGTSNEYGYSVQQTADGGYIVAGTSYSNDGDVTGNHGNGHPDCWVVKLDGSGILQWQKCLGGTNADYALSVQQTADGGYIVGGGALSNDGDVTGNHGSLDYWLVKLNNSGNIQWQKCLGGTADDWANSVQQTADGGFIVVGWTLSNNGDVTGNHGNNDYWAVKVDSSGNIQWQKCLGGTNYDYAWSVQQITDGGFIVAGYTESNNGDVTGNHGVQDYWLVKLDSSGNLQWQKCLGGTGWDESNSVQQTSDGGYIVAGRTASNDGDVTGNHGGTYDSWVAKLDNNGNIQWQKCLGGTGWDQANSVEQTADGGYIVAGRTTSNNGDVTGNHGGEDYWVVKLDGSGNIQWQKCLGGTIGEAALSIEQTADGGFIVAGNTVSNNGDVTGNHDTTGASNDYWVVKLFPDLPTSIEENNFGADVSVNPNPFTTQATISFNKEVYNATFSLYNLLGEKVAEVSGITGESFRFNRGNLSSGVYVFEVREEGKNIYRGKAVVY